MTLSVARRHSDARTIIPQDWRSVLAEFPEDIRDAWEERAAIIEYDGREPRPTAERRAFECVLEQFEEAQTVLRAHFSGRAGKRRSRNLAA